MTSWHDLRIWLSGFLGALALAAFVAATLMRALDRAWQGKEAVLKRPVASVDVFEKVENPPCLGGVGENFGGSSPPPRLEDRKSLAVHA